MTSEALLYISFSRTPYGWMDWSTIFFISSFRFFSSVRAYTSSGMRMSQSESDFLTLCSGLIRFCMMTR